MAGNDKRIYVEIDIRGPIDRVWQLTQTPELHKKWDLRFTDIEYLPRPDPALPQRFLYSTRIGFGLNIRGGSESAGHHDGPDGQRSSALKFWSQNSKSLIREGSGYWKYIPVQGGNGGERVRFLTVYDYSVRFGLAGWLFDRMFFRPLMGWATAWSFDRLRLWVEKDVDPAASLRQSMIHGIARLAVAFVWVFQGLIPKLMFHHPDEVAMVASTGLSDRVAQRACIAIGLAEVVFGFLLVLAWGSSWPLWVTVAAMPIALTAVAIQSPQFLIGPFNVVVVNASLLALAAVAIMTGRDLPSAARCLRRPPPGGEP